jgi:FkbM family methyltransferase
MSELRQASRSRLRRVAHWPALAPLYRLYRRDMIRRRISEFPARVVRHAYGASELSISLEDPLAEGWYDHDWPVLPELVELAASRLKPGARVFDLGAHQGIVAMMLADLVGSLGQVVAVEAERHNHQVAGRNLALNGIENLELIHAAVGATEGSLRFTEGLNGRVLSHGGFAASRVPAITIDGLAARHGSPDVVFIDVEGYEVQALRGAARCIAAGDTDFFVEVHVACGLEAAGGSAREVLEALPPERFLRLISRVGEAQTANYGFEALDVTAVPDDRFFLIARPRRDGTRHDGSRTTNP